MQELVTYVGKLVRAGHGTYMSLSASDGHYWELPSYVHSFHFYSRLLACCWASPLVSPHFCFLLGKCILLLPPPSSPFR